MNTRIALRKENGLFICGKHSIMRKAIEILTTDDKPDADYYYI